MNTTAPATEATTNPIVAYFGDALPHFLGYFGASLLLAVVFLVLYTLITPHKEFALIKNGNTAAATQLVGTFLGFAVPMAIVIGHSVSIFDMALWGAVVLVVQLAVFFVIAKAFSGIEKRIEDNCSASGVFIGGIGLGIGILQAACMVP
jgi:putative membrane protein